jgi:hypothetical protein
MKAVVTTDSTRRGVFFGEVVKKNIIEGTCVLKNAQMCVYWSAETKGVLGLAKIGPQIGSKITPIIPELELNGVTSIMKVTKEAEKRWREEPWD